MIIAGAQIQVQDGEVRYNLEVHYELIAQAARLGVGLIVFPVMSLTGYQRIEARNMAFSPRDSRLQGLATMACENQMYIVAGAPLWRDQRLFIGAFVLGPNQYFSCYVQQFLHTGETAFFDSSLCSQTIIDTGNVLVAPALGCDIEEPLHVDMALQSGAQVYGAGLFSAKSDVDAVHTLLAQSAHQAHLGVVMANYCGNTWGQQAGGKSACWDPQGQQLAAMPEDASGLVLLEKEMDHWAGSCILF